MELFLIRHARAEVARAGLRDERRRLTPIGLKRWHRSVEGLRALGISFDRLYHSPWLRAVETADAATVLLKGESVVTGTLTAPPRQDLLDALEGKRVAVVGHEPWLTQLLAWLVLGDADPAERFVLKKGGVAWLEGTPQPGKMRMRALFTPAALRTMK
jgi:phosphohistidine phosphatase